MADELKYWKNILLKQGGRSSEGEGSYLIHNHFFPEVQAYYV